MLEGGRPHDAGDGCPRERHGRLARSVEPRDSPSRRARRSQRRRPAPEWSARVRRRTMPRAFDHSSTSRSIPWSSSGTPMGGMVVTEVGSHPPSEASRLSGRAHARCRRRDVRRGGGRISRKVSSRACKSRTTDSRGTRTRLPRYLTGRGWSATDAQEFVLGCRPQRAAASVLENTQAAWRSVPSTFVSCDDSEMSAELRALFGSRATDVIEMPGDHFPIWLRPARGRADPRSDRGRRRRRVGARSTAPRSRRRLFTSPGGVLSTR